MNLFTVERAADWYISQPTIETTRKQLSTMREYILADYAKLVRYNQLDIVLTDSPKPYETLEEMTDAVRYFRLLEVYSGGTSPVLDQITNLAARVVHDLVHVRGQYGFDYEGECGTYSYQVQEALCEVGSNGMGASRAHIIRAFYWSEIVGQASYKLVHGVFPGQRIVKAMW